MFSDARIECLYDGLDWATVGTAGRTKDFDKDKSAAEFCEPISNPTRTLSRATELSRCTAATPARGATVSELLGAAPSLRGDHELFGRPATIVASPPARDRRIVLPRVPDFTHGPCPPQVPAVPT